MEITTTHVFEGFLCILLFNAGVVVKNVIKPSNAIKGIV